MYSVRVSINYRAPGVMDEGDIVWFWIGPHYEYDRTAEANVAPPGWVEAQDRRHWNPAAMG